MNVFDKYPEIEIIREEHNIQIKNSYLVIEDVDKNLILDTIIELFPNYLRTKKSMLREWKSHNILYQKGYKQERTRDVDFEDKPKLIHTLIYFLISVLMKERQN